MHSRTHTHLHPSVSTRERRLAHKEGGPDMPPAESGLREIPVKDLVSDIESRQTTAQTRVEEVRQAPKPKIRYWQSATQGDTITVQRPGKEPLTVTGKKGETVKIRDERKGVTVKMWYDPSGDHSAKDCPWQYQVLLLGSSPQDPAGLLDCTLTTKDGTAVEFRSSEPEPVAPISVALPRLSEEPTLPLLDITPTLPATPERLRATEEDPEMTPAEEGPTQPLLDITPTLPATPERLRATKTTETPESNKEEKENRLKALGNVLYNKNPFNDLMNEIFGKSVSPDRIAAEADDTSLTYKPLRIDLTDVKTEDLEQALPKKAEALKEKVEQRKQELCKFAQGCIRDWAQEGNFRNYYNMNVAPGDGLTLQVRRGAYVTMDIRAFCNPDNALTDAQRKAFQEALRPQTSDVIDRGNALVDGFNKKHESGTLAAAYLRIQADGSLRLHHEFAFKKNRIWEVLNTNGELEKSPAQMITMMEGQKDNVRKIEP